MTQENDTSWQAQAKAQGRVAKEKGLSNFPKVLSWSPGLPYTGRLWLGPLTFWHFLLHRYNILSSPLQGKMVPSSLYPPLVFDVSLIKKTSKCLYRQTRSLALSYCCKALQRRVPCLIVGLCSISIDSAKFIKRNRTACPQESRQQASRPQGITWRESTASNNTTNWTIRLTFLEFRNFLLHCFVIWLQVPKGSLSFKIN